MNESGGQFRNASLVTAAPGRRTVAESTETLRNMSTASAYPLRKNFFAIPVAAGCLVPSRPGTSSLEERRSASYPRWNRSPVPRTRSLSSRHNDPLQRGRTAKAFRRETLYNTNVVDARFVPQRRGMQVELQQRKTGARSLLRRERNCPE